MQDAADEIIEKGGDIMPTIVQQIKREIANQYKDESRKEKDELARNFMKDKENLARKLMHRGMDIDSIVELTGISRERLNQILH